MQPKDIQSSEVHNIHESQIVPKRLDEEHKATKTFQQSFIKMPRFEDSYCLINKLEPIVKSLNFARQESDTNLTSLLVTNEKILFYQITQAEELLSEITQEATQADCGSMVEHDSILKTKIKHLKKLLNVLLEKSWRRKKYKTARGTKPSQDTEYDKVVEISLKLERVACTQHQKEVEMRKIKIWHDVYKTYTEKQSLFGLGPFLDHNIRDPMNFQMLKKMLNVALPSTRIVLLSIFYCKNKRNFNSFRGWFTPTINFLTLYSKDLTDVGGLLLRISKISHRILENITLDSFKISGSQLKRFFMLVKHVKCVRICFCKLNFTEVIDLDTCLKGTTIRKLLTTQLARSDYSDWENKPEGFSNFIESLSKSDLKISLQTICIGEDSLRKAFIEQVLAGSELSHVDLNME
ncbi:unnamed protein product [Moneuplotes crassus]|uniref:Uncharacterized protein n=1 Tax=Euplotes crassus TaxID=5936 RepID=A0AAD1UJI9_EUPCR|nr:unnamed protein product [Moneuplotes crassus]